MKIKILIEQESGEFLEAKYSGLMMNTVEAVLSTETPQIVKAEKAPKTPVMVKDPEPIKDQVVEAPKTAKKTDK